MERSKLISEFTTVAVVAASLVFGSLAWINAILPPGPLAGGSGWLVRVLTATGTYFFLFKILLFLYFNVIWQITHRKIYLGGHWTYRFNDSFDLEKRAYLNPDGCGIARIDHTPDGVTVHAETFQAADPTFDNASGAGVLATWDTHSSCITGERLEVALRLRGLRGPADGIGDLHIVTSRRSRWLLPDLPQKLCGFFYLVAQESNTLR